MMKLKFYRGPGDMVTKIIRVLTNGPYSHVEVQFSNGHRFFASGHGVFQGAHMIRDHRVYGATWDTILIPATQEQEDAAQRFAFSMIGIPFDFRGMCRFMLPGNSHRRGKYCSAVILDVLQKGLHMFPGVKPKISPNGLHRLFLSYKHTLISDSVPNEALASGAHPESLIGPGSSGSSGPPTSLERELDTSRRSSPQTWFR
jgi:hypothetical protein